MKIKFFLINLVIFAVVYSAYAGTPHAPSEISKDARQAVQFPPQIKTAMLARMRENFAAIHEIHAALAAEDFETAADVAENQLGTSSLGPHNARQQPYMPPSMQHLGMAMHSSASDLARALQEHDMQKSLKALTVTTSYCVACHATYRAR
ncbi:MAG: hypothetical protein HY081_02960 [Gammaproteobacteria bacterium]|nr:hypothetical protein [Gammaproteobacteria bacterium]